MSSYALTTVFSMDPNRKAQLIDGLEPKVIAMVEKLPGFTKGYWTWDHTTNVTYGFVVFDTEANARALESYLRSNADDIANDGARLERAAVGEVIGTAER
jgi:hypothetical protein